MYSVRHPQAGVYKIRNTVDGKVYIGGTRNLEQRRRSHFTNLRLGCHHNPRLQKSYNVYGKSAFVFNVIQTCLEESIHTIEQKYIDEHKSCDPERGYNIAPRADSTKGIPCPEKVRKSVSFSNSTRVPSDLERQRSREKIIRWNKSIRKVSDEKISEMMKMKNSGIPMTTISLKFGLTRGYLATYVSRIKKAKNPEEVAC